MAHTQKKQHAGTPLHVTRCTFPWTFRALLQGGPPLFISSFLFFFFFPCLCYFCKMKPTGTEKIILSGRGAGPLARPLAGWLALLRM